MASTLPSPLKSPVVTSRGWVAVVRVLEVVVGRADPVFIYTDMLVAPKFVIIASVLPSPLKSPATTPLGCVPVVSRLVAVVGRPEPVLI